MRPRARALVVLAVSACACSDDAPLPPLDVPPSLPDDAPTPVPPVAATEPPAYVEQEVAQPGIVVGVVRWRGNRPRLPVLDVERQHVACGRGQPSPVVTIGPRNAVADAIVSIEVRRGKPLGANGQPLLVAQHDCLFTPHVLAVPLGRPILFRNDDPVLHNLRAEWEDGTTWLEVGQPREEASLVEVPPHVGALRLLCDAGHPWTLGWLVVYPHPYFAVTGLDGAFRIDGVPPGEHEVRVWHEGWEVLGHSSGRPVYSAPLVWGGRITVSPGAEVNLEAEVGPGARPPGGAS